MTNGCLLNFHNSRQTDRTTSVQIRRSYGVLSQSFGAYPRYALCMTFSPNEFHGFSEFSASRGVGVRTANISRTAVIALALD